MRRRNNIHSGLDALLNSAYGLGRRACFSLEGLRKTALAAQLAAQGAARLTEPELSEALLAARGGMRRKPCADQVAASLGALSEAARRSLGVVPYVEQLMGVLCMGSNTAIQMQTGEGKTVTAAMAAVMAGWKGSPCHVVTSNDYLAERDARQMAPLIERCGLSASHVVAGTPQPARKAAYACDVTYSTSKELLADFLRDRLAMGGAQERNRARRLLGEDGRQAAGASAAVMRGLHTAIVDEADSVLIDEATVPLIISLPNENKLLHEAVLTAKTLADSLTEREDYHAAGQGLDIVLTAAGRERIAAATAALPAIWQARERAEFLVCQALTARHHYRQNVQYVVIEGKVTIVDDKTGRIMEGRSWSGGLHQAIEAKDGLELTDPTYSHSQMSFQLFFRLYRHLAGMSGTLQNVQDELWSIYGLLAVDLPTHLPKQMAQRRERVFADAERKWTFAVGEIVEQIGRGRAVLVGARSIVESEELHRRVSALGIEAAVLNALRHEQEAAIVAQAGRKGRVTIATNMAGRGTDILVADEVLKAGGLHVIATERHESRRVDMQLFGRTSRQGAPGSVQMLTSLDDDIFRRYAWPWLVRLLRRASGAAWGEKAAVLVNRFNQRRAESAKARLREKILLQDVKQSKSLSFADH